MSRDIGEKNIGGWRSEVTPILYYSFYNFLLFYCSSYTNGGEDTIKWVGVQIHEPIQCPHDLVSWT